MITKRLFLSFPPSEVNQPIVYRLIKEHNLVVKIYRAKITEKERGFMALEIKGEALDIESGLDWVKKLNFDVYEDTNSVQWDSNCCVHCGNCVPHCPTSALSMPEKHEMKLFFDESLCIECMNCIDNCPFSALRSLF